MAIFWKNPMEKLADELKALRKRATQLAAMRDSAKVTLDDALAARERNLLNGNLEDVKTRAKLQAAVDSALSELAGFDAAITAQAALVTEATLRLEAERKAVAQRAAGEELAASLNIVDDV